MEQGSCRSTFDAPCRRHRLWYGNLCFLPNLHAGYLEGRRTKSFGAGELPVALFHSGLFDRAVYFPIVLPVYLWDGGLAAVEPREKDGVCLPVRRCRFGAAVLPLEGAALFLPTQGGITVAVMVFMCLLAITLFSFAVLNKRKE